MQSVYSVLLALLGPLVAFLASKIPDKVLSLVQDVEPFAVKVAEQVDLEVNRRAAVAAANAAVAAMPAPASDPVVK